MAGVTGVDLTAAMLLGESMGADVAALAELLPPIEAAIVETLKQDDKAQSPR